MLTFEILVCLAAVLAMLGYWRASGIYWEERSEGLSELKEYRRDSIKAYTRSQSQGGLVADGYLALEPFPEE